MSSAFFFQAEDGIRDKLVTGVQTCALPIYRRCEYVDRGLVARVEVLMLGAVRDVQGRTRFPVVSRAVDDAEAAPGKDVDRLLAVRVLPGMGARRDLRLEERGPLRWKPDGLADDHGDPEVLRRLDPPPLAAVRDDRRS